MTFRKRYYPGLQSVTQTRPGCFVAHHERHGAFEIQGGRAWGGTKREWFLSGNYIGQNIACASVADALRLIESL